MKFRLHKKQPIPVADGDVDNKTIFDLDGIAAATGWTHKGAAALYEACFPTALQDESLVEAIGSTLATWADDPDKVIIRNSDFRGTKDDDFAVFLVKCAQRKLNPWRGEAYPLMKYDSRRGNHVALGVTIETQRAIAHATNAYAGMDAPTHEYAGDSKYPVRTLITVYKLVDGHRVAFSAESIFEEYFPGCGKGTLAEMKPHVCNATVAEAGALRRAFPRELSEMYNGLEFARPGPGGGAMPVDNQVTAEIADEDIPHTYMGLHMALLDLGLNKPAQREAVIDSIKKESPGLLESEDRAFYAKVITAVKRDPMRWGAAG